MQKVIRYRIQDWRVWETSDGDDWEEVWRPTCFEHAVKASVDPNGGVVEELMDAVMGECYWCKYPRRTWSET